LWFANAPALSTLSFHFTTGRWYFPHFSQQPQILAKKMHNLTKKNRKIENIKTNKKQKQKSKNIPLWKSFWGFICHHQFSYKTEGKMLPFFLFFGMFWNVLE